MRYRVVVGEIWWTESASLSEAQALALTEAGTLAGTLGQAVEARVTDPAGALIGAAIGRTTGDARWRPASSARSGTSRT